MVNTQGSQEAAMIQTHEIYIAAIRDLVIARMADRAAAQRLGDAKLVYGSGMTGTRGVTFFQAWKNGEAGHDFVEICATGEESDVQIAGTTIHELAHVLAGPTAGHGKEWKAACALLGLTVQQAAGQSYSTEHFEIALWAAIAAIPVPTDGAPVFKAGQRMPGLRPIAKPRPCPLGIGSRGGTSRGPGSGSRLRLYICSCAKPMKVRVASDDFDATCHRCGAAFTRAVAAAEPPADEAAA
jgi:hypothetical protein